mmetsp:Transcript_38953/g.111883  ORF Transcript_38953/g.111883 Transcript_38953/m.111883 type:complete len:211 (+) Transcript_38953:980-1612(+)
MLANATHFVARSETCIIRPELATEDGGIVAPVHCGRNPVSHTPLNDLSVFQSRHHSCSITGCRHGVQRRVGLERLYRFWDHTAEIRPVPDLDLAVQTAGGQQSIRNPNHFLDLVVVVGVEQLWLRPERRDGEGFREARICLHLLLVLEKALVGRRQKAFDPFGISDLAEECLELRPLDGPVAVCVHEFQALFGRGVGHLDAKHAHGILQL